MADYNTKERLAYIIAVAWIALFVSASARTSEAADTWLYELTTRTGMPHLEENLRYTTTQVERCLSTAGLMTAFDALSHEALRTCRLDPATRDAYSASYVLHCESREVTGTATWDLGATRKTGTLNVKMGGKNMTFFQRVSARPLRKCASKEDG